VLVADIKHGKRLIDTDHPPAFNAVRHRPRHPACSGRQIENLFIALQYEHIRQLPGQLRAHLRDAAVELGRVLRIVEAPSIAVLVRVAVFVAVLVMMTVIVSVFVTRLVFVAVLVPVSVIVAVVMFMFVCHC
jgi:hypothetical protein